MMYHIQNVALFQSMIKLLTSQIINSLGPYL